MLSIEDCRKVNCEHLKYKINGHTYNKVYVCEVTGGAPRYMVTCPEGKVGYDKN